MTTKACLQRSCVTMVLLSLVLAIGCSSRVSQKAPSPNSPATTNYVDTGGPPGEKGKEPPTGPHTRPPKFGDPKGEEPPEEFPQFHWPPPKASAFEVVPNDFLVAGTNATTLGVVESRLRSALEETGYSEKSYYAVPGGFALVSHLEQISEDGASKSPPDRWSLEYSPPRVFGLMSYLKALLKATPGHYRLVVFIVTNHPLTQSDATVDLITVKDWLRKGATALPQSIKVLPYTSAYNCTGLIYEFEKLTPDSDPHLMDPSGLPGRVHLEKSKLWFVLARKP